MELEENAVVAGKFRLNRMLGRGGMGSVWHATHLGLDTACAVKFIEGEFAALPEAQARFQREAQAAARLQSPHVVSILDYGVSEGRPYIAMELLEGEDLGKRLQRVKRLPPNELVTIIGQVCRALTKAHAFGIVHRDLKPDNIFLVKDDDREIAKVLDFGIAKSGPSGQAVSGSNTKTGAMLGTPYYMSPEQAQGTKTVDHRSDLWSLAVICYQALTGKLPFESEALGDLLVKIIVGEVPTPSQDGFVPPGFDAWWKKAASRAVGDRFQSAKEFADSLSLAIGVSQATDIMDARAVQAAIARGGQGQMPSTGTALLGPNEVPQSPALAATPRPFGMTPQSAMAQSVAGPGPHMGPPHGQSSPGLDTNTGAPTARTFSGVEQLPAAKKPPTALLAVLGLAMLLIGGLGIAVLVVVLRKSSPAPDAAAAAGTQAATTGAASATAPPPTAPPSTPEATASATAAPTAPAASSATAAATPAETATAKIGGGTATATTTHRRTTTSTAADKPAGTAKPAGAKNAVDTFGF